jgi:hypothetical protein
MHDADDSERQRARVPLRARQAVVPGGCIQFVVKDDGAEVHSFDLVGIHARQLVNPGATETWSVNVSAGQHQFLGSLAAT